MFDALMFQVVVGVSLCGFFCAFVFFIRFFFSV